MGSLSRCERCNIYLFGAGGLEIWYHGVGMERGWVGRGIGVRVGGLDDTNE